MATRYLRNQDQDFALNLELASKFLLGLYFGSPVANASVLLESKPLVPHLGTFMAHLVPQKIFEPEILALADPTSPLGAVGASLLLGNIYAALIYCFFIGFSSACLYRGAKRSVGLRLFLPFLVVACGLSMMYNHFANLTFFWIPLVMSILIGKYLRRKYEPAIGCIQIQSSIK